MTLYSQHRFGYSKVEWLSFFLATLCLLSLIIPGCNHWRKDAKAAEAITNIQIIFDAQQKYFAAQLKQDPARASFLSLPMTPQTPSASKQLADFQQEPWASLALTLDPDVLYTYEVWAKETGHAASFAVYVRGDLDGDGNYSIYKMHGSVDANGKPMGRDIIYKLDPLE